MYLSTYPLTHPMKMHARALKSSSTRISNESRRHRVSVCSWTRLRVTRRGLARECAYIRYARIRMHTQYRFLWRGKVERDIVGGFCDSRDDCHVCRERTLARDSPRAPFLRYLPASLFLTPISPHVPVTCAIALARPARTQHSPPVLFSPNRSFRHRTPCTRQVISPSLFRSAHSHSRPFKCVPVNPVISRKLPLSSALLRPYFFLSFLLSLPSLSFSYNKFASLRPSDWSFSFSPFLSFALLTIPQATTTHRYEAILRRAERAHRVSARDLISHASLDVGVGVSVGSNVDERFKDVPGKLQRAWPWRGVHLFVSNFIKRSLSISYSR